MKNSDRKTEPKLDNKINAFEHENGPGQNISRAALTVQRNEITEFFVYTKLAKICKNPSNADVLREIGKEELGHAKYWKSISGVDVKPNKFKVFWLVLKARIFGLTFTLKLMEKGESSAQKAYETLAYHFPEAENILHDEEVHEKKLLNMLDEEMLQYVGSIVLGLNDALVELTGALAGFTLALGSTRLISITGLVTGIAASLSMAASNFLSNRAENNPNAGKSALYTGISYLITVVLLILPFILLENPFIALAITLTAAVIIIYLFNYYLSVAKDLKFIHRFLEMAFISLGVSGLSFGIGYILKNVMGMDV